MSWIARWIAEHCGGNPLLRQAPREWKPEQERFTEYFNDVVRARYGLLGQKEIDLPIEQFVSLLKDTLVLGTTEISELVVNTANGPVRVRARENGFVGFTDFLDGSGVEYRTGRYEP